MEVLAVAALSEESEDVFLLFWCEKALAIVIAIVGTVATKVILDGRAQRSGVALFHVGEERIEAPGGLYLPYLLVMATLAVAQGCGIDGRAYGKIVRKMKTSKMAEAGSPPRGS